MTKQEFQICLIVDKLNCTNNKMSTANEEFIANFNFQKAEFELEDIKHKYRYFKESLQHRHSKIQISQPHAQTEMNRDFILLQRYKHKNDHRISLGEFAEKYTTDIRNGLTEEEARNRLNRNGLNELYPQYQIRQCSIFIKSFANPFTHLLWIGSILAFISYGIWKLETHLVIGIVVSIISCLVSLLLFWKKVNEYYLRQMSRREQPHFTTVIRNRTQKVINSKELVQGDLVLLAEGNKIAADLRIIQSHGLQISSLMLTGESKPVHKSTESESFSILDAQNIIFSSSQVVYGQGRAIVFGKGQRSFINQIVYNHQTYESTQKPIYDTPYEQKMKKLAVILTIITIVIGGILFGIGYTVGYSISELITFAIGFTISSVSEGLVLIYYFKDKFQSKIREEKKMDIKSDEILERLCEINCIVTDKTGTFTRNRMTVSKLWFNEKIFQTQSKGVKEKYIDYEFSVEENGFQELMKAAVLLSKAHFIRSQEEKSNESQISDKKVDGTPTDSAILRFFQSIEDVESLRAKYPVIKSNGREWAVPFTGARRYTFSIHRDEREDSHFCLYLFGTADRLKFVYGNILIEEDIVIFDNSKRQNYERVYNQFQKIQRVLAYAKYHLPKNRYPLGFVFDPNTFQLPSQLALIGMITFNDPPREEVLQLINQIKAAGIKVVMSSGDQKSIVAEHSRMIGLINQQTVNEIAERTNRSIQQCMNQSNSLVIHGDCFVTAELEEYDLPESQKGIIMMKWLQKKQIVFARITPNQRLQIVQVCQKAGYSVIALGSALGNLPAIKQANIGISLGKSGTDVNKQQANVVLLNDDLLAITEAIAVSKLYLDNLKKSICYCLTSQLSQVLPFFCFILFQIPCPITTAMILYISVGTELLPALSLLYEEEEENLKLRKPIRRGSSLINGSLLSQVYGYQGWIQFWGALFCYYVVFNDFGFSPFQLQFTANKKGFTFMEGDVYDPSHPTFGNTYLYNNFIHVNNDKCPESSDQNNRSIDWIYNDSSHIDLRLSLLSCSMVAGKPVFKSIIAWSSCKVHQISIFTDKQVCYTTEAAKHAQTAYALAIIWSQIFNSFVCKTRIASALTSKLNFRLMISLSINVGLIILVTYCRPFNTGFGTRNNIFMHLGIPVIPFFILQLTIQELKKLFTRIAKTKKKGNPHWLQKLVLL